MFVMVHLEVYVQIGTVVAWLLSTSFIMPLKITNGKRIKALSGPDQ